MLKLIIFDLDRTIFDWDRTQEIAKAKVNQLLKPYCNPKQFWQYYHAKHDVIRQQLSVEAYRIERYLRPLQQLGIDDFKLAEQLNQCFVEHALTSGLFCPAAEEVLDECKKLDVKIVLLSNGLSKGQALKIKTLNLNRWFDAYFISEEQGVAKLEPQAFLNICQKFNVQPQQCLMVGDHLELDIVPAHDLGMQVFWINSQAKEKNTDFPAYELADLTALIHTKFNL